MSASVSQGKAKKVVSSPQPSSQEPPTRRRNYARWRAVSLSLVYVAFAVHIIHWKLSGKTLAPLELNEVMYTLELGIITAGFIFMCLLVLGTLIFGRFFCSWACHILVLQDLCSWLLRKIGIRTKPIRSRLLLWVPPLTACYMFLWPQIIRAWNERGLPTFYLATDADGWASFATTDFWRNLPGPWIIAITFVTCGFAIVYLLGSRTFCTYVCPYGAVFALADRFSPGRILVNDRCVQCGKCTAACTSGIRVHDEVRMHGMVVNPSCMKDLDCVSACPEEALRYGFSRPALFKSDRTTGRFGVPFEFSIAEELIMAAVFLVVLLSMRGLYARIPFLLSLALGVITAFACILTTRLAHRSDVLLSRWHLKETGRLTTNGMWFLSMMALVCVFVGHSAVIRYHEYLGLRGVRGLRSTSEPTERETLAAATLDHFSFTRRWGLFRNERIERALVDAVAATNQPEELDRVVAQYLERYPYDAQVNLLKARRLLDRGNWDEAAKQYRWITEHEAENASARSAVADAHAALGGINVSRGLYTEAVGEFQRSIKLNPDRAAVRTDFGGALAELGRFDEAIVQLTNAVRLDPSMARAQYNLGTLLNRTGRVDEAVQHLTAAADQLDDDPDVLNNLGAALTRNGQTAQAGYYLLRALALRPDHADAHFNLGVLLTAQGDAAGADVHFREAVRLDGRYAEYLNAP